MIDELLYALIRRAALEKKYDQANQIYALLWELRLERVKKFCCNGGIN